MEIWWTPSLQSTYQVPHIEGIAGGWRLEGSTVARLKVDIVTQDESALYVTRSVRQENA